MRTFIAIDLAPPVKRPLIQLLRSLPRVDGVKWCTEPQLHVTLKFLGDITDVQLGRICKLVADISARIEPFDIIVGGLGCFPGPANPRVLWCGVGDETAGCRRWVDLVDPPLEAMNFKPETRAFTPHVTLGRSKSTLGSQAIQRVLETAAPPACPPMRVEHVTIYESVLGPGGSRYRVLATAALGAGGATA